MLVHKLKLSWHDFHQRHRKLLHQLRFGATLLVVFSFGLGLLRWGLPVVVQPWMQSFFAIDEAKVAGDLRYASLTDIEQKMFLHTFDKALYQVKIDSLSDELEKLPWVESAKVVRVWPNVLNVQIEETVPIATWNHKQVLSSRGDVFSPADMSPHADLPSMVGKSGEELQTMAIYRQASKILRSGSLRLIEIEYQQGLVWALRVHPKALENVQFELYLNSDDGLTGLYRFIDNYVQLAEYSEYIERVDLRYPTGMAVRWHERPEKFSNDV